MSKAKLPTPQKLPSVGVSRDDFETWWHFVTLYCQQNQDYNQFFPGGKYDTWIPETMDATRGITIEPIQNPEDIVEAALEATRKTSQLRLLLSSLLTTIAAFCPEGTFKPVLSESSSIQWIKDRIAKVCKIQTTGRHLPKILNIKWDSEKDTPDAFFLKIKSAFQDSLMPKGTRYHGIPLTTPETMGPLTESIIVIKWLEAIHPALPNYIMENRGDLFTDQTPNFCDIQPELCNIMDSLLAKVQESDYMPTAARVETQPIHTENIRMMRTRPKPVIRRGTQQRSVNQTRDVCNYCIAIGKEERVWSTHTAQDCYLLFPDKKKANIKMITIPVETDEYDNFTLSDAMESLAESYRTMSFEENNGPHQEQI